MAIKGTIRVQDYETVRNMVVGECKYMIPDDLHIANKVIFLHLNTAVYDFELDPIEESEEGEEDEETGIIVISRIGDGLTEDDFDLDFSGLTENYFFDHDPIHEYNNYIKYKDQYILFYNFEPVFVLKGDNLFAEGILSNIEIPDDLESQLKQALDAQDYDKAAEIRDKIEKK